jgi:hypothetical protein
MLEHQKIVLDRVKNDKQLFRKELIKSMVWLDVHQQTQLRKWVREKFYHLHTDVIKDVFYPKYDYVNQ